jgi:hypothetical protein
MFTHWYVRPQIDGTHGGPDEFEDELLHAATIPTSKASVRPTSKA